MAARFEAVCNTRQQVGWVDRFVEQDELMTIAICGCEQIGRGSLSGKQNDFAVGEDAPHGNREVDTAHSWENHVSDKHFRRDKKRSFERGFCVVCGYRCVSVADENFGKGVGDAAFVVDHQDAGAICVFAVAGSRRGNILQGDIGEIVLWAHGEFTSGRTLAGFSRYGLSL